ncbi:hypothetical protein S7711_00740 [Stachybotrys chartarum IBT 7711]|uniref:RING-type E3 ubiquitin transferase n=1 Tax=Stachybotrys chartarum (strain CBS 109288 / IBT 7711) TaxID=1280523 RepID=A0A084B018_STACB|nr:hypothetical protein S7711_00740 [Stachybotrys chartarum IBT 7711]
MSSPAPRHDHLDAASGREVVYCHQCRDEWYRVDHGLICPSCESEATEIISPENDPRDFVHHSSASTSPEMPPSRFNHPDPDEADIDDIMGSRGFRVRQDIRDGDGEHHNPGFEPVLEHFIDLVNRIQSPRRGPQEESNAPRNFDPFGQAHSHGQPHDHPHVHRTTFTSTTRGGGTTSVTIVSGSSPPPRTMRVDPFQAYGLPPGSDAAPPRRRVVLISSNLADAPSRLFNNIMRDVGPPAEGVRGGPSSRVLEDGFLLMMSSLVSDQRLSGDAVYTQEALDRIITNLMEANPQSNAAPPASDEALGNLDRRPMDESMMNAEGKTECTICIDDMTLGQLATTLPCKHRFHDECVVLWLKEHNTCPVCRAPIEKSSAPGDEPRNADGSAAARSPGSHPASGTSSPFVPRRSVWPPIRLTHEPEAGPSGYGEQSFLERPTRSPRPPSQSQSRLNEAMRSISSRQMQYDRDLQRDNDWASLYDQPSSASISRRTSHSPTSPRGDHSSRIRHRSPSSNSRQGSGSDASHRQSSGHGPFSWLRDRFSGNGGSGNSSSRNGNRG